MGIGKHNHIQLWILHVVAATATSPVLAQEIIVDNTDSGFTIVTGTWASSTTAPNCWGTNYLYKTTSTTTASGVVEWRPNLPQAGNYEVAVWYTVGANRTTNAPYTVNYSGGSASHSVNQQTNGAQWVVLGTYPFAAGTGGNVQLTNLAGPSVVIADAVRFRHIVTMQTIAPNDPRIHYGGLYFADIQPDAAYLLRFSETALAYTNLDRALNTTGVTIRFRTNSSQIKANFIELPSLNFGDEFGVYQDGVFDRSVTGLSVVTYSKSPGEFVTYELVCPSYARVALTGLEIEASAELVTMPPVCRIQYAAFGDSITHGYGQHPSSYLTYPWKLAAARRWELFNVAVSGSRVTPELGSMLAGKPVDLVTVLWGQNDWNGQNDLPLFISQYQQFLTNLRAALPSVPVYCITILAPAAGTPNVNNGYTREDYRQAVRDIVSTRRSAGDSSLFVIEGLDISTTDDIGDGVHLSVAGADRVASRLVEAIRLYGPASLLLDSDCDCNIDAVDFDAFSACYNGPVNTVHGDCLNIDVNGDQHVDAIDFDAFSACYNGPTNPPGCN